MRKPYPVPGWHNQPHCIISEDWDKATPDTNTIAIGGTTSMFMTSQGIPSQGWVCTATLSTGARALTLVTNHVGVWNFNTGTTINSTVKAGYSQGNALNTSAGFNTTQVRYYEFVFLLTPLTNVNLYLGLAGNWLTLGTQFALLQYQSAVSPNWEIATETPGAANTTVNTGLAANSSWHVAGFEHVFQPAEAWNFYLDGVLIGTISTNLPAGLLMPGFYLQTTTIASKFLLVDDTELWADGDIRVAP